MRLGCLEPSTQPTLCLKLSQAVAMWRSVTCRCQPACLAYGKWEGSMSKCWAQGSRLVLQESCCWHKADGMTGLNSSSKCGIWNNKIAKCLCRQSTFRVCGSISLQARKGLIQWQVLGIRKPVWTLQFWDVWSTFLPEFCCLQASYWMNGVSSWSCMILVLKNTGGAEKLVYIANMRWKSGFLSPRAGPFSGAESSGSWNWPSHDGR